MRLIDADALFKNNCIIVRGEDGEIVAQQMISIIRNAPTVDAVSRGVLDQIRWERDFAMWQLEQHGIPFGGIAPDVVKVVRCKECKHFTEGMAIGMCKRIPEKPILPISYDAFCCYGERRVEE